MSTLTVSLAPGLNVALSREDAAFNAKFNTAAQGTFALLRVQAHINTLAPYKFPAHRPLGLAEAIARVRGAAK